MQRHECNPPYRNFPIARIRHLHRSAGIALSINSQSFPFDAKFLFHHFEHLWWYTQQYSLSTKAEVGGHVGTSEVAMSSTSRCFVRSSSWFFVLLCALHVAGATAAATPAGEMSICRAAGAQSSPAAVTDGAGGMIVTWLDARRGLSDLYAQHVRADGIVDPVWTQDGSTVTRSGTAGGPTIFSDGQGGALIVWFDNSTGAVCAQRMLGDGSRAAGWPDSIATRRIHFQ